MVLLKALNSVQFKRTWMSTILLYIHLHFSVVRHFPLLREKGKLPLRTSDFLFSDLSFTSCFFINCNKR